jgi:hypothetical protein
MYESSSGTAGPFASAKMLRIARYASTELAARYGA